MPKSKAKNKEILAVIPISGQQFLVKEKEEFSVDHLNLKNIKIKPYLIIKEKEVLVGKPEVKNYICEIKVVEPIVKGEKKIAFKFHSKTGYHKKKGFRPLYSQIRIEKIKKIK